MAQIGSAGVPIRLPLGESPITTDTKIRGEMQEMYNALHILNGYLGALREEFEGNDTNTPAENMPFRRRVKVTALQPVAAGNIVTFVPGGVVKGVSRSDGITNTTGNPALQYSAPGRRLSWQLVQTLQPAVALEAKGAGEIVEVGLGAGILEVPGVACGQIVWAADSRYVTWRKGVTNDNAGVVVKIGMDYTGDGALYLSNPQWQEIVGALNVRWEGQVQPGYPFRSGDWWHMGHKYLWPVGVGVANGYVLIRESMTDPTYY